MHTIDALLQKAVPFLRLVNFGNLGDGNLHYNVQPPSGGGGKLFLEQHEDQVNTLVFDSIARFQGSISAEHGVGCRPEGRLVGDTTNPRLRWI